MGLKGCFDTFDRDKVGYITPDVVKQMLQMMGLAFSAKELKALMAEITVGSENPSEIGFDQFCLLCSKFMEEESEDNAVIKQELKEIFNIYDKERVGYMKCMFERNPR